MTAAPTMTAIELTGVAKSYGTVTAVSDMSLTVDRGQMFGLIGPDGAGKTTAIRLICGLLSPDAGRIQVLGRDPVREHRDITERVGYLSQRFSLYGDLSVDENIEFFAEVHGVRDYRARREQLLELTQLVPFRRRLADRLSGGMKQKLALACTLVHEPEIVLLDEPTTGVDPISRREFWKLLSGFLARGVTIVMSTPYLDEAERCTRVALVHEGRVLAADEPSRLRGLITAPMVEVMTDGSTSAVDLVAAIPGVVSAQSFGDRLHVALVSEADAVERFIRALQTTSLGNVPVRRVQPSLEDVFIARLGKESAHA